MYRTGSIRHIIVLVIILFHGIGNACAQMWNLDYQNKFKPKSAIKSEPRASAIPNDPLLFPNNLSSRHQYYLDIQANGFSIDYPATWQYARGHAVIGLLDTNINSLHPDIMGNYREHLSDPALLVEDVADAGSGDHGSWVLGVLAATSNNNEGLAGVCQNCSVIGQDFLGGVGESLRSMLSNGVQVVNMSWGADAERSRCADRHNQTLCGLFENEAIERDVLLVSISQNRHGTFNTALNQDTFPGNHPNIIQVGGLDQSLQFWNDCEGYDLGFTCGSRASQFQELVAPAKDILVTITDQMLALTRDNPCEIKDNPPYLNYNVCSGTSFAAPQVSGLIGIVRSVYPQLSAANVRLLLQKTAQSPHAERHDEWGYGLINPLRAVTEVLGKAAGIQQTNRSIPFFVMRDTMAGSSDTAFSSNPQFAAAILSTDFRAGYQRNYQPLAVGMALSNYQIPSSNLLPYSVFHILGTHNNPLQPGEHLIKLYRLSKLEDAGIFSLDHAYVTAPYIEEFKTAGYEVDAIEGYIFPPCDAEDGSCQPPAHSECLFARNTEDGTDWAIMLESQLEHAAFQSHTVKLNNSIDDVCLGYAYKPIDSDNDGLIDGYEAFLGTNINQADSDNDGRSDGEEMLVPIEAMFSDPLTNAEPFEINPGITGAWVNPRAPSSGQGLLLDVMIPVEGEPGRLFGAWFVYDLVQAENGDEFGSTNHRWFTVQGTYVGDKSDLTIYLTENGRFDNVQAANTAAVGTMEIRFTTCTTGVASYSFDQTNISGSFPITRLTPDKFCENGSVSSTESTVESVNNNMSFGGLSGAWANPQAPESGQGLLFDVMEDTEQVFLAWFTYSIDNNNSAVDFGSADHRWFTAQGSWSNDGSEIVIYLTDGGVFDKQRPTTTQPTGSLQVTFDSCTSGTVSYQFPDLSISGSFPVQRLTPDVFCENTGISYSSGSE